MSRMKCDHLEYSELKDQTKDDLLHDYCHDQGEFDINMGIVEKDQFLDPPAFRQANRNADECQSEMSRISRVLQNKYKIKKINCKMLEEHWRRENEERK